MKMERDSKKKNKKKKIKNKKEIITEWNQRIRIDDKKEARKKKRYVDRRN